LATGDPAAILASPAGDRLPDDPDCEARRLQLLAGKFSVSVYLGVRRGWEGLFMFLCLHTARLVLSPLALPDQDDLVDLDSEV
jgi:hypothetical protein